MRALLVILGTLLVGCTSDPCGRQSPCPNDPRSTPAQQQQCRAALDANASSACYAELVALANCASDNVVCGSAGTTDTALTQTRQRNNCSGQVASFQVCCASHAGASACQ